jgi:hypothetical protein
VYCSPVAGDVYPPLEKVKPWRARVKYQPVDDRFVSKLLDGGAVTLRSVPSSTKRCFKLAAPSKYEKRNVPPPRLMNDVFTDHSSGGAVTFLRMKNVEESVDAIMDAQEDVDEMRAELKVKILEITQLEKEFRFQN